jgi:hypothetical protein
MPSSLSARERAPRHNEISWIEKIIDASAHLSLLIHINEQQTRAAMIYAFSASGGRHTIFA